MPEQDAIEQRIAEIENCLNNPWGVNHESCRWLIERLREALERPILPDYEQAVWDRDRTIAELTEANETATAALRKTEQERDTAQFSARDAGRIINDLNHSLAEVEQERDLHADYHAELQKALIVAHGKALPANWEYVDPQTTIDLMIAEITTTRYERDLAIQERDEARRDCADLLEAAKAKLADCLECQDAALMEGEYCSNECGALAIAVAKAEGRQ